MMKILIEKPPIWDEAHKHFEIDDKRTIFAWGDTLYNPGGVNVDQHFMAHEETHSRQQERCGGPQAWWDRYFADPIFRVKQEEEAYGNQYKSFCAEEFDRNARTRYLHLLAQCLASPMYDGNLTLSQAKELIDP